MAVSADSVILELEARTGGFDANVRRSAQTVDQSMSQVERSATRAESVVRSSSTAIARSFDQTSQRSRLLGYQISDIGTQLASGSSPFLILAQQAPQVANALDGTKNVAGRLATFFSGPWGAALLAAGSMLGIFLSKNRETGESIEDLVRKLEEQARKTDLSRQAQEQFARTVPGVIAAIREETEALRDQNRTLGENQRMTLEQARIRRLSATIAAAGTVGDLAAARANVSRIEGRSQRNAAGQIIESVELRAARAEVSQLEQQLASLNRSIALAEQGMREAQIPMLQRQVEAGMDGAAAATLRYEQALERLNQQLRTNGITEAEYQRRLTQAARARDRDIEAARDARRTGRGTDADTTAFQMPVQGRIPGQFNERRGNRRHAGIDIAVPVGTPVGAAAAGTVIEIGNIPGYGNTVVIDHGRGTTTRYAHLSQITASRGQQVGQGDVLGLSGGARGAAGAGDSRGPHVHYEVRRGGRAVDPRTGAFPTDALGSQNRAEQIQEQAARLAEQRAREEASFQDELAQLHGNLLDARRRQLTSVQEQAEAEIDALNAVRQRDIAAYQEAARRSSLGEEVAAAHLDELIAARTRVDVAKIAAIRDRAAQQLAEERYELALTELRDQQSIEQAHGALARTVAERRDSELRLLDLQRQEETLQLAKLRAAGEITAAEQARAQALADQRYGLAREGVERNNLSPLGRFVDEAPRTALEMNEAFETLAANGLANVNDALGETVASFINLGGTAGRIVNQMIADLVRLLAYRYITAPFAGALGLGGGGGASDSFGLVKSMIPGFATGGSMLLGGRGGSDQNLLSLNGSPLARVSRGERMTITPQAKAMSNVRGRASSPRPQVTVISAPTFDLSGAVLTHQLMREVDRISQVSAARAAAAMGQSVMKAVPGRMVQYQSDGV